MSDPLDPVGDGHTEISDEDSVGLIPTYIATRAERFEAEEQNIAAATFGRSPTTENLLDDLYLRQLHHAMFNRVWKWAGQYRTLETNIGIDPTLISTAVRVLVDNTSARVEFSTDDPDDIALRFHHRIVQMRPFVNGNGRHGRIAADLLARALQQQPFTWGRNLNVSTTELRDRYQAALRRADIDPEDIGDLAAFARS